MNETRWLDPEEAQAWRSYIEATTRVRQACDTALAAETGLTLDDYGILVALSESPEHRMRMNDLAAVLATSPSRMTYRIDRLVKLGHVCRESCPTDRRGSFAVLTPEGMEALRQAAPVHVASVRDNLVDHMTGEEFVALGRILQRVVEALRPDDQP